MLELDNNSSEYSLGTHIKAIGVGGAGGNAIETMIEYGLNDVEFLVLNTNVSDLEKSKSQLRLQIGEKITRGLGAGSNPDVGRKAAEESKEQIKHMLQGADLVFIVSGMGGGTGTGSSPIVASIAKELGILTIGIVNTPFKFEGKRRMINAHKGIQKLKEAVDTLIVVPNAKLQEIYPKEVMRTVFKRSDEVLYQGAKAISDIIQKTGFINVDFADVRTVMKNRGYALMGTGYGEGDNRAVKAAENAMKNPLLADLELSEAEGLLINVTVGPDFKMEEYTEINDLIVKTAGDDGDIIPGLVFDDDMEGKIKVTLIATGLQYGSAQIQEVLANQRNENKPKEDMNETYKRIKENREKDNFGNPSKTLRTHSTSDKRDLPDFMNNFKKRF